MHLMSASTSIFQLYPVIRTYKTANNVCVCVCVCVLCLACTFAFVYALRMVIITDTEATIMNMKYRKMIKQENGNIL